MNTLLTKDGHCLGYIFNFNEHGAFDPNGKVGDYTQAQIDAHNAALEQIELDIFKKEGKGLFYLSYETPKCTPQKPRWQMQNGEWYERNHTVSTWAGHFKVRAYATKFYASGFGGSIEAHSVWFTGPDGKKWYGVQKGHGQAFRARRLKNQK